LYSDKKNCMIASYIGKYLFYTYVLNKIFEKKWNARSAPIKYNNRQLKNYKLIFNYVLHEALNKVLRHATLQKKKKKKIVLNLSVFGNVEMNGP